MNLQPNAPVGDCHRGACGGDIERQPRAERPTGGEQRRQRTVKRSAERRVATRALNVETRRKAARGKGELGQLRQHDARKHGDGEREGVSPRAQQEQADDQRR
jgi:hypothetical protein